MLIAIEPTQVGFLFSLRGLSFEAKYKCTLKSLLYDSSLCAIIDAASTGSKLMEMLDHLNAKDSSNGR